MKRIGFLLLLIFICNFPIHSDNMGFLTIQTTPEGLIPLGSSSDLFKLGTGMRVTGSYIPAAFRFFGLEATGNIFLLPIQTANSVWVYSFSGGPVVRIPLGDRSGLRFL